MTSKLEILDKNTANIDTPVDKDTAQKAYDSAVKKMAQHVNIPGFRKGKAPKNVIVKYLGVDRIKVQVVEDIFPFEFNKAVADNKLEVATQPSIEAFSFELGKDLTITAKVELNPKLSSGNIKI